MDDETLFQYEFIRQEGRTNMFDAVMVRKLAIKRGFINLANAASKAKTYAAILEAYKRPDEEKYKEWKKQRGLK
jgi:hypothetical protein